MSEQLHYFSIEEFWEKTGNRAAVCDICYGPIFRGGGHLMTTEDVTSSKWYMEEAIPKAIEDAEGEGYIETHSKEAREAIARIVRLMAYSSKTQWVICDKCMEKVTMR